MTWALVPVKGLSTAKARLASVLSAEERQHLAEAMLEDVLTALLQCRRLEGIAFVTRDPFAVRLAGEAGVLVLAEPPEVASESAAVAFGAHELSARGVQRMIVLPLDIPGIKADEVDDLIAYFDKGCDVVFAPSADGGTNGLLAQPPEAISFHFGDDSLAAHIREAEGLHYKVVSMPSLAIDIDGPEALRRFLQEAPDTASLRLLQEMGIPGRLLAGSPGF